MIDISAEGTHALITTGQGRSPINIGKAELDQRSLFSALGGLTTEIARDPVLRFGDETELRLFESAGNDFAALGADACEARFLDADSVTNGYWTVPPPPSSSKVLSSAQAAFPFAIPVIRGP